MQFVSPAPPLPNITSVHEQAMDPMETLDDSSYIHMLSDPSGGGDSGPLSFARLSAPLPYLTPHPGRSPCLQAQEVRGIYSSISSFRAKIDTDTTRAHSVNYLAANGSQQSPLEYFEGAGTCVKQLVRTLVFA